MEACEKVETNGVNRYALAAWFCFASAVVYIPLAGLSIYLMAISGEHPGVKFVNALLQTTGPPIAIFVLYMFRRLLNDSYDFHRADKLIAIQIWAMIVTFPLLIATNFMDADTSQTLWLIALGSIPVVIIFQTVITILFARRLLTLNDDLYGLKKSFVRWTIVAAILQATIILMPLGVLAYIATQIMLGVIFLRAKDDEGIL